MLGKHPAMLGAVKTQVLFLFNPTALSTKTTESRDECRIIRSGRGGGLKLCPLGMDSACPCNQMIVN